MTEEQAQKMFLALMAIECRAETLEEAKRYATRALEEFATPNAPKGAKGPSFTRRREP